LPPDGSGLGSLAVMAASWHAGICAPFK